MSGATEGMGSFLPGLQVHHERAPEEIARRVRVAAHRDLLGRVRTDDDARAGRDLVEDRHALERDDGRIPDLLVMKRAVPSGWRDPGTPPRRVGPPPRPSRTAARPAAAPRMPPGPAGTGPPASPPPGCLPPPRPGPPPRDRECTPGRRPRPVPSGTLAGARAALAAPGPRRPRRRPPEAGSRGRWLASPGQHSPGVTSDQ